MATIFTGMNFRLSYNVDTGNGNPTVSTQVLIDEVGAIPVLSISSSTGTYETYDSEYVSKLMGEKSIAGMQIVVNYIPDSVSHQFLDSMATSGKEFQLILQYTSSDDSLVAAMVNGMISAATVSGGQNQVLQKTYIFQTAQLVSRAMTFAVSPGLVVGDYGLGANGTTVAQYTGTDGNAFVKIPSSASGNPAGADMVGASWTDSGVVSQLAVTKSGTLSLYAKNGSTAWSRIYTVSQSDASYAKLTSNLSDLPNKLAARQNLVLDSITQGTVENQFRSPSGSTYVYIRDTDWGAYNSTSGPVALSVARGGTGALTAANARTNLGLGTSSTVNTGTSGATIPLLNGTNSWSGANTYTGIPYFDNAQFNIGVNSTNTTAVGIKLGSLTVAKQSYIDFRTSGTGIDRDARIISSVGTGVVGGATLSFVANTLNLDSPNYIIQNPTNFKTVLGLNNVENYRQAQQYSILPATATGSRFLKVATITDPNAGGAQLDFLVSGGIDVGRQDHTVDTVMINGRGIVSASMAPIDNFILVRRTGTVTDASADATRYWYVKNSANNQFDVYLEAAQFSNKMFVTVLNIATGGSVISGQESVVSYFDNPTALTAAPVGAVMAPVKYNYDEINKPVLTALSGTLAVANGGTGGTTQAAARTGLGLGTVSTLNTGTTIGNAMTVGTYGFGGTGSVLSYNSLQAVFQNTIGNSRIFRNDLAVTGMYRYSPSLLMSAGDNHASISVEYNTGNVVVSAGNNTAVTNNTIYSNTLYGTSNKPNLTADVAGILPVTSGGTGASTVPSGYRNLARNSIIRPALSLDSNTARAVKITLSSIPTGDASMIRFLAFGSYSPNDGIYGEYELVIRGTNGTPTITLNHVNGSRPIYADVLVDTATEANGTCTLYVIPSTAWGGYYTFWIDQSWQNNLPETSVFENVLRTAIPSTAISLKTSTAGNHSFGSTWTTFNTSVDAQGFIKKASPVIRIVKSQEDSERPDIVDYSDFRWSGAGTVNREADGVTIERTAIGVYVVHGSLGFAQEGWKLSNPKDPMTGSEMGMVESEVADDGTITISLFKRRLVMIEDEEGDEEYVYVKGKAMDVPVSSWIDARLEMPVKEEVPPEFIPETDEDMINKDEYI